ncbi:MAG TPA: hypothetical protein VLF69_05415 [Candidatus Saccharimonadales bacterium]|nr:hypothetical protein [Candidatus Saccharimonadales bacterium]
MPGRFKKLVTVAIDETFGALRERFDERMYATAAVYDLAGTAMAAVMDPETSSRVIAAGHYHALLGGAEPGLRTGLGFYNREDRSVYVPEGLTPLSAVPITEFDPREVGCPEEPTCNWF